MSLLGETAPEFTLEDTAGRRVTLSETLHDGPTIVVMFRAHWCQFCAEQLGTFSDLAYDLWHNHDVDVLPVSCDSLGRLREMRDRYDLRVQLLSDPSQEVTEAYTEVREHPRRGVEYTRSGTFVVDTERTVRYEQIADNTADRTYANYLRYCIQNDFSDRWEDSENWA